MPVKKAKIIKQNVGVDISKDDFKVSFWFLDDNGRKFIKGSRSFKNILVGFQSFIQWLDKKRIADLPLRITLEATGVYHENLVYFLHEKNCRVSVVLANQAKAFARSLNLKTKTDKVDAKMLGQMGIERDLSAWHPFSPGLRAMKQLTRDRVSLLTEKIALSNKLHALMHSFGADRTVVKRLKQRLKLIERQIKEVGKQIKVTVEQDTILAEKVANISQIKGLALVTVATIIAETNGFELFTSRSQLVSYAGLDVVERQSGSSVKGKTRISKKGNSHIRRALYFPAISAVKHEPEFKKLFDRLLERSKIKMKAYVAVQRKLLLIVYTLFKNNSVYDPQYQQKQKALKEEEIKQKNQIKQLQKG